MLFFRKLVHPFADSSRLVAPALADVPPRPGRLNLTAHSGTPASGAMGLDRISTSA
jgi:hypothetical protein